VASHLAWRAAAGTPAWACSTPAARRATATSCRLHLFNVSVGRAQAQCHAKPSPARRPGEPGQRAPAEKSPNFGYAELGRRVFVSARLDF
jgi:outer membrane receptor for ferrienterochelin and colicins